MSPCTVAVIANASKNIITGGPPLVWSPLVQFSQDTQEQAHCFEYVQLRSPTDSK